MRTVIPILVLVPILILGCISTQTQNELTAARKAVAQLQISVADAEAKNASNLEALRAELNTAQAKLLEVETKATAERKASGASVAEGIQAGSTTFAPLFAGLFPGAGVLFGLLGTVAGAIKDSLRKA